MILSNYHIGEISKILWIGLLLTGVGSSLHATPQLGVESSSSKYWKLDSIQQFEEKDGLVAFKGYIKLYPPYAQGYAPHLDIWLVGAKGEVVAAMVDHIATVVRPRDHRTSIFASYETSFSLADVSKAVAVRIEYHAESHAYCPKSRKE